VGNGAPPVKQRARTFYDAIEPLIAIDPFDAFDDILFVDVDNVIGVGRMQHVPKF
jgi:hypothetical protein